MTAKLDRPLDFDAWLVKDIPAPVALFDRDLRYVAASPAWIAGFALSRAPLAGDRHDDIAVTGRAALAEVQRRALAGEAIDDHAVAAIDWLPPAAGAVLSARAHRDRDGVIVGVVVALRMVLQAATGAAVPVAAGSGIGLGGRDDLAGCLRAALAGSGRDPLVLFAVSLDGLRSIHNLHGRAVADRLLNIVAERLVAGTRSRIAAGEDAAGRSPDIVTRLGPDQFGILCGAPGLCAAAAAAMAARLLALVQAPIALDGRTLAVGASIGCLATTAAHRDEDAVLRDLDIALQQAQAAGPGRAVAWEPALTAAISRRHTMAEELRRAFDNGEFTLHYQPVLRLDDNRMVGAEALLRWNHPSEGLAPSAAFVPVLEESGLIVEVGCWVVREAARQVESWRVLYGREIVDWVSVNLSARQLEDPAPLLAALRGVHDGGFSAHRLKLEIAEPVLMHAAPAAAGLFADLDALGVRFAVDDFGTGAVPLDGLGRYPVDAVKIDARFVAQIGSAAGDKLVEALLAVGHQRGVATIAEGIETAVQRDFLRRAGCPLGQGYLLAEPMDGALLGAYALTHAVSVKLDRSARPADLNLPTSAGRSRAG